jgi:hypothetical protein
LNVGKKPCPLIKVLAPPLLMVAPLIPYFHQPNVLLENVVIILGIEINVGAIMPSMMET